ncbi:MAG: translation elongation factor 4 [Myxococcota bacterium]|nr:translation elongation factor 4 [Myxococcota bacterium]
MSTDQSRIRNFAIIAHIDHGKSTLADRLMGISGLLTARQEKKQYLDKMDLERERGITIKAQTVVLTWTAEDGEVYTLNLIDTPGHVDFTYEVSRSLSACEGALLVVDATQGVEAQTLSNVYLAIDQDLEIIPVINKIDLPSAEPYRVLEEIEEVIGIDIDNAVLCSAKSGIGIENVLEAVVKHLKPPTGNREGLLQALIVDSWFDTYVGVIVLIRVKQGEVRVKDRIKLMETGASYEVTRLGVFSPEMEDRKVLRAGEVGYLICAIKRLADAKVGDTVTHRDHPAEKPLPGFADIKPMVFSGIYPVDNGDFENLRAALEKLQLNDAAFSYEPETSDALGFGFRCGYLGLLHMEVIQERLEREYDLDLINTSPSVVYKVMTKKGAELSIHSPSKLPPGNDLASISEPIAKVTIHVPQKFIGPVLKLCEDRRGTQVEMVYTGSDRVQIIYEIPYAEIVYDFFDKLKGSTKGYASMDYEVIRWEPGDLIKLDILVNGESVDALSTIIHRAQSQYKGQGLTRKLKEFIPRQMYQVAIQASIGSKIIARTNVQAMRKDVTAKCYGGDISRKRKLLEKQKKGKKRMKAVGSIEIPQRAFMAVLSLDD